MMGRQICWIEMMETMTEEFRRVDVRSHQYLGFNPFYALLSNKEVHRGGLQSERTNTRSHNIRRYKTFPLDGRKGPNMDALVQPFLWENVCWTEGQHAGLTTAVTASVWGLCNCNRFI